MSPTAEAGASPSGRAPTAHASAAMEQPDLLDLDIDELSPLPPAHGFSNGRSTSLERIPSFKLDTTPRTAPSHAADPTAVASPALSAATSSFHLEASSPSSPRRSDGPEQQSQTPPRTQISSRPDTSPEQAAAPSEASRQHEIEHDPKASRQPLEPLSIPAQTPSARYVTVSAILSRSEMYYAPETSEQWDILRSPQSMPIDASGSNNNRNARPPSSYEPFSSLRRRRSQRKRPSNGSAIEALGALLLRKDSSGRVANLSFARSEHDDAKAGTSQRTDMQHEKQSLGSKHGVQAWTNALSSISRNGLRLQLPHSEPSQPSTSKHGATIAERRAQMWKKVLTRQGAVVEDTRNGFSKVRSRRGGLSFEVGNVGRKQTTSTLLQLDNYQPEGKAKQRRHANGSRPDHEDDAGSDEEPSLYADTLARRSATSNDWSHLPETIVLKAGRRPRIKQQSKSEFGIGSAYYDQALPEAPPSPVAMPGAWHGGSSWRSKPGDGYDEGALLLPPPLLDDNGSDASSFEGLLGVRRMREREKAKKQAEKLAARNRPAHKVGPLTALTNFVKAAHAAETFAKRGQSGGRSRRAPSLLRSFTEPPQTSRARSGSTGSSSRIQVAASPVIASSDAPGDITADPADATLPALRSSLASAAVTPVIADADARTSPAVASASPFMSPSLRRAILSRRGSRNNSIDASGRMLNTVFESEPLDPSQIPDDELASPDLPPISSPLLRPSSTSSGKTSAFRDFPAAPRLLPVQLSVPPSPFTPLAVDLRESRNSMGPAASGNGDYLSARNIHSSPRTPQLVPTMLSLPPSPWTPYQNPSVAHAPPMVHLHLNTSTSSLRLAPGTPRLVPTHIEILPSPFPTSSSSRRGSLSYDSPHSLRAGALTRSPLTAPVTDFASFAALRGSQAADAEARLAPELKVAAAEDGRGEDKTPDAQSRGPLRLTPSSMLVATQLTGPSDTSDGSFRKQNEPSDPHDATFTVDDDDDQMVRRARRKSFESVRRRPSADQGAIHVDSAGRPRSFVLWFLIGDLGLRGTASSLAGGYKQPDPDHGGVAALFIHAFFFFVFVAAHVVDLAYSVYETASLLLWFLRWMLLNLTGRTVLAQCVVEAYGFIQAEWATVAIEDHEEKGSKKVFNRQGHRKPKGLSRWQVLRGLVELYCLHSVTRERYLEEGAGLKELEGWRKASKQQDKGQKPKTRGSDRMDIGAHRAASRAALGTDKEILEQRHPSDAKQEMTTANLATPGGNSDIKPQLRLDQLSDSEEDNGDNNSDNGSDDDAEDDDSSDDEMIVTNRGDDILEFAKTPRIDAARPGQASTGYFGRAYDFMTSPQVGASKSGPALPSLTTLKETNRDLVRTIKWCGRLAISAYGLHVHIVDLPPTFTPSGDRFSRQTFAYLSRLNADDVLHADIQTLDADADYSPTFYIVRDYVRKVVCVAVRGTQSFSDIIVDLELQTEEIELPQVQPTPGEEFRCHAGIWRAAKALVSPQSKLFATLRQALEENEGFGIMFCGHSLGGAIASAAALLLAEYFIPDGVEPGAGTWVTNMSSGLPARRLIRAVSFASPVTMTADLAARAALGSVPLVTTVVLGSDVIPRVGHGQVRELRRVLGALSRVRRRHAMASKEGQEDARVHILRSFWDWRSIKLAEDADDVMLHRKERIEQQLWSLRREVESDLYAAIKARLDAESSSAARIPPSPWVGPQQRDQAPLHALSARRQGLDAATLRSEAAQGGPLIPPGRCIWINDKRIYHVESPLAFFSLPELRSDMFAAHFPAAYEEAILELRT